MYRIPDSEKHNVHEGQFGLVRYHGSYNQYPYTVRPYMEWYNCRDSFHLRYNKSCKDFDRDFYYVCNPPWLRRFVRHVEDDLYLNRRTKLYNTNMSNVVCILPAPFWRKQLMRLSLFSLILRAGLRYDGSHSWKRCLHDHPYIAYTEVAVDRFFAGHTRYRGSVDSWWRQFDSEVLRAKGIENLDKLLTIPSLCERTLRNFGYGVKRIFRLTS